MKDRSERFILTGSRLAFVSYASEDDVRSREIERALHAAGIRIWIDHRQLDHRDNEALVSTRIWDALGASTDFVLLASRIALTKPWIRHELQIASERWLATGAPKIWLVTDHEGLDLPDTPYSGILPWTEDVGTVLSSRMLASGDAEVADDFIDSALEALRVQYLMGGSTAVKAINSFDAIFPKLRSKIDEAAARGFRGSDLRTISWLRTLAKFLDLRAEQAWLCAILHRACAVPSSARTFLLNNLSTALIYRGASDAAIPIIDEVGALWKESGDWLGVAVAFGNRALAALEVGDVNAVPGWCAKAEAALGQAVAEGALDHPASRLELLITRGNLHNHRGRALARRGAWQAATEAFSDHLALAVALEDRRGMAAALGRIAWLDLRRSKPSLRTHAALERYLALSTAATNPRGVAFARAWRGQLAVLEGALDVAIGEFLAETSLRDFLANPNGVVRANVWCALCLDRLGRKSEASKHRTRASIAAREAKLDSCDRALLQALEDPHGSGVAESHPALAALLALSPTRPS